MSRAEELRQNLGGNMRKSMAAPDRVDEGAPGIPRPAMLSQQGVKRATNAVTIEVGRIVRDPNQPREEFDKESLERLAQSMKTRGQLQSVQVRWDEGQGAYVMIAGERRWLAAQLAGLTTVTAVIREGELDSDELLEIQLVENCIREDLKPIEQAKAFQRVMLRRGWTTRQLAAELSLKQPDIVRTVGMLDLPEQVQEQVDAGIIPVSTAYELSQIENPAEQVAVAEQVAAGELDRADVRDMRKGRGKRPSGLRVEIERGDCKLIGTVTGPAPAAEEWIKKLRRLK